jgi:hypothetical protein
MLREDLKHELAILLLWLLAVVPTLLMLRESGLFTYLGPLYFLCMVGSVYIVRSAKRGK